VASNLGNFASVGACSAREFEELLRASANYCKLRPHTKLQIVWSNPNSSPFRQLEDDTNDPSFDAPSRTDSKT
jgi:hypothetical protein